LEEKQMKERKYWLIDNGGIPMWMAAASKEELEKAGIKVLGGPR
jgi:hypothetical protein